MKNSIVLLLFLWFSVQAFALPGGDTVSLKTASGTLEGSLLVPASSVKMPVVLIVAGSGPTDRNGNNPSMENNSLKLLAEGLEENGIASLRYDKRGVGRSRAAGVEEKDLRFEHFVEDVESWIDFLKADDRFSSIVVLGHSEGSTLGMIASNRPIVSKFISVAGPGFPAGEIIRKQLGAQSPFILKVASPLLDTLEMGDTLTNPPIQLYSLFRPSVQPYMISWLKYNPQEEISTLYKPILIVQGTTDLQVSVADADTLAAANSNATKLILEGMNHVLKLSEADRTKNLATYSDPNLPLKEGLMEALVAFIKE